MNEKLERLRLQIVASETASVIGARIREARAENGWTRRRLVGEMDGLATENDVYRWETGKHRPRDDALAAAARALGKPLAWFIANDQPQETPEPLTAPPVDANELLAEVKRLTRVVEELLLRQPANSSQQDAQSPRAEDQTREPPASAA